MTDIVLTATGGAPRTAGARRGRRAPQSPALAVGARQPRPLPHFGRNSIATVRGTTWRTTERADGTVTQVIAGAVSVRDLRRHRSILVRAGHRYLARAKLRG